MDPIADGFIGATSRLQSTAKWLTATFGAIAALVIGSAGMSIADAGSISRAAIRLAAAAVALVGAVWILDATAAVFLDRYVTLADLSSDLRNAVAESDGATTADTSRSSGGTSLAQGIPDLALLLTAWQLDIVTEERVARRIAEEHPVLYEIARLGPELYGGVAQSLDELQTELDETNRALRSDMPRQPDDAVVLRSMAVHHALRRTLAAANFFESRERFRTVRTRIARGVPTIGVALAVALFLPQPRGPSDNSVELRVTSRNGAALYGFPEASARADALGTVAYGVAVMAECKSDDGAWYRTQDRAWLSAEDAMPAFGETEPPHC